MQKFKIPYGRQFIEQDDIDAVVKTLQSDFLTQGPKVQEFEEKFAKYVGAEYAIAVSNATAGLHLSMLAMGLKKGERVITTPITFAASANCVRFAEAEVWLADISPSTYLLDVDATRKLLESKPKGFFSGIIPVDLAGLPVNLEAFKQLADEYNLWIVEDAAHAPGGYFIDSQKQKVLCGSNIYSDCAVFSFHPVKHIACGEGGMITTNSKEVYDKLVLLRTHGITKTNMQENHGGWYYEMQELGYNYRLTDIQATLGITQLEKNDKGLLKRNKIAEKYKQAFSSLVQKEKIKYQYLPRGYYNAHHLFIVEVAERKELYNYLHKHQIFVQIHYIPLHFLPYYKEVGYGDADLKNAEKYYEKCISLPMFPSLTEEEQNFVIEKVLEFYT